LAPSKAWSLTSYQRFRQLATVPDRTGVFLRPAYFYFREPVEDNPVELTKMKELADHVLGFVHRADLIEDNGVNPDSGMVDAYTFLAPMVDTDRYLSWLHRQAAVAGCSLLRRHISGDLRSQEQHLRRTFAADLIVNCTGLGAHELAGDKDLSPHRGAVIRVENTGEVMPRITAAHCVANNPSTDHQDMIFIVPRGENQLVLGGLVEPGEWDINVGLDYAPIRDLLRRNVISYRCWRPPSSTTPTLFAWGCARSAGKACESSTSPAPESSTTMATVAPESACPGAAQNTSLSSLHGCSMTHRCPPGHNPHA
jgi:D-amino-acid oxidase